MAASAMRSFLGLVLVVSLVGVCTASSAENSQNGNQTVTIVCKGQRWCGTMNYTDAEVAMKCVVGGTGKNASMVMMMEGKVVDGERSGDGEDEGADDGAHDGGMMAHLTRTTNQTLKRSDECSVQLSMPYNSLCTSAATKPFRISSVVSSTANNASSANNNKQPEISFFCQAPQRGAALTDSKTFASFFFFKNFNPFFA